MGINLKKKCAEIWHKKRSTVKKTVLLEVENLYVEQTKRYSMSSTRNHE